LKDVTGRPAAGFGRFFLASSGIPATFPRHSRDRNTTPRSVIGFPENPGRNFFVPVARRIVRTQAAATRYRDPAMILSASDSTG
jgi:hypothetical protein